MDTPMMKCEELHATRQMKPSSAWSSAIAGGDLSWKFEGEYKQMRSVVSLVTRQSARRNQNTVHSVSRKGSRTAQRHSGLRRLPTT